MAKSKLLDDEELRYIAQSPWIGVNAAPLAEEILRLRAEIKELRASTRYNDEWHERLGCLPSSKL